MSFPLFPILLAALVLLTSPGARGEIRVAGSSTVLPVILDLAPVFEEKTGIRLRVVGGGSDAGVAAASGGKADIGMVSRALTPVEANKLVAQVIGHDGVAIIVNGINPLVEISTAQVREVFSRNIEQWSALGWRQGGDIVPVIKSAGRSTRVLFDSAIGIGNSIPPGLHEVGANVAMLLFVAADPQAIGYLSFGTIADGQRRRLAVKSLRLDGVAPTLDSCRTGRYPLCRPLNLVTRPPVTAETARFLEFMTSAEALEAVRRRGFTPEGRP